MCICGCGNRRGILVYIGSHTTTVSRLPQQFRGVDPMRQAPSRQPRADNIVLPRWPCETNSHAAMKSCIIGPSSGSQPTCRSQGPSAAFRLATAFEWPDSPVGTGRLACLAQALHIKGRVCTVCPTVRRPQPTERVAYTRHDAEH